MKLIDDVVHQVARQHGQGLTKTPPARKPIMRKRQPKRRVEPEHQGRLIFDKQANYARLEVEGDTYFEQGGVYYDPGTLLEIFPDELPEIMRRKSAPPERLNLPGDRHPLAFLLELKGLTPVSLADQAAPDNFELWEKTLRYTLDMLENKVSPPQHNPHWRLITPVVLADVPLDESVLRNKVAKWIKARQQDPVWLREKALAELKPRLEFLGYGKGAKKK
jgi:hypothetical protein